jgi:hypothetical protein
MQMLVQVEAEGQASANHVAPFLLAIQRGTEEDDFEQLPHQVRCETALPLQRLDRMRVPLACDFH